MQFATVNITSTVFLIKQNIVVVIVQHPRICTYAFISIHSIIYSFVINRLCFFLLSYSIHIHSCNLI